MLARRVFFVHVGVGQSPWAPKRARSAWCTLGRFRRAFEQALAHPWMSNDFIADYVLTVQDDPAEEKRRSSSTDHHHHLHH